MSRSPAARTDAQRQYDLAIRTAPPRRVRARFGTRMIFGTITSLGSRLRIFDYG